MRAVLRQDPDIIFVGEIRDSETAEIAAQASMTGHLVLATVHSNDAVGVVGRLTDLGLDPALLAESLRGCVGQRLVRRLCEACKVRCELTSEPLPLSTGSRPYSLCERVYPRTSRKAQAVPLCVCCII